METVRFQHTGTAEFFVARLDDKKLRFSTNNEATAEINRGQKYTLQWFVRGAPGSTYTMEVTDPEKLKFKHEGTLDGHQKAAGITWLLLEEVEG